MPARYLRWILPLAALLLGALPPAGAQEHTFPLRTGDTWVMVGDSITAQHLHTNYFEAFCFARFPNLTFRFRNSGVGGDRIPTAIARWVPDVARWRPTVVSVELGMNDAGAGYESSGAYLDGMKQILKYIRSGNARPVLFSASPVNDGSSPALWKQDPAKYRNAVLDRYATALRELMQSEKVPYADQFHMLAPHWGRNTALWNALAGIQMAATYNDVPGVEALRDWLKAYQTSGVRPPVDLKGDAVHPREPGQLTMAAALLTALHAPGLVSQATIDVAPAPHVVEAKQCTVSDLKMPGDTLTFARADQSLPFPIADEARPAIDLTPYVRPLSQWMLAVRGVKDGNYQVKIDDVPVAVVTGFELKQGWNMGFLDRGPVADQCRAILRAVADKEKIVDRWRGMSMKAGPDPDGSVLSDLAQVERLILEADTKIRQAARPLVHRFSIAPA
jgi:lysophospholipase L1-like esterase